VKYWEIYEPYYALIKAKCKEDAVNEYIKSVAGEKEEFEYLLGFMEEVEEDYALVMHSRGNSEDGNPIPAEEILDDFRSNQTMVLLIDGSLL
jgi:hypothetical protein